MEKVINLSIPHVAEQIFAHLRTKQLFEFMEVSSTWKVLAQKTLWRRHKGKPSTCFRFNSYGILNVVKQLLGTSNDIEDEFDCAEVFGEVAQWLLENSNINAVLFEELNDVNQSWADFVELMLKYSLDHGIGNVKCYSN